jgi:hypothetical protein
MNTYNFFDDVVFIYSNETPDVLKRQKYFEKNNIPVCFLYAENDLDGWCSLQAIHSAYNNNSDTLLIFKDDFIENQWFTNERLMSSIEFMQNNNWDIFCLGYSLFYKDFWNYSKITNNIISHNPSKFNVICYTRHAMKEILLNYEDYIGIVSFEEYISKFINCQTYCICPTLFNTSKSNQFLTGIQYSLTGIKYEFWNKYMYLLIVSIIMFYIKKTIIFKVCLQKSKIDSTLGKNYNDIYKQLL